MKNLTNLEMKKDVYKHTWRKFLNIWEYDIQA